MVENYEQLENKTAECEACMKAKFSGADGKRHIVLCGGTGCLSSHSEDIRNKFSQIIKEKGLEDKVTEYLDVIRTEGMEKALEKYFA